MLLIHECAKASYIIPGGMLPTKSIMSHRLALVFAHSSPVNGNHRLEVVIHVIVPGPTGINLLALELIAHIGREPHAFLRVEIDG